MGVYSINNVKKENSELENYIENTFLERCLNPEAIELHEEAESLERGKTSWNEVKSFVDKITESSLSDDTKAILIDEALECMRIERNEIIKESGIISESVLLEYSGNENKNKEFMECLKDLEELCNFNTEKVRKLSKYMKSSLTFSNEIIKSPKVFKQKVEEMRGFVKEYNEWYNKASKTIRAQVTFSSFAKKVRMFNNKYAEPMMEEKKKIDSKLSKLSDEIAELVKPWVKGGESIDKLLSNSDNLDKIDQSYSNSFRNIAADLYNVLIDEANYTNNDIRYCRRDLKLEKENTITYKIVNKLLK